MIEIFFTLSVVLFIFLIMTLLLTYKKMWKLNMLIWGLFGLIFSPIISYLLIKIPQYITEDAWSGLIGLYLFPVLEVISIIMIICGVIGLILEKKYNQQKNRIREIEK